MHSNTPIADLPTHNKILSLIEELKLSSIKEEDDTTRSTLEELYTLIAVKKHNELSKEQLLHYFKELALGLDERDRNIWLRIVDSNIDAMTSKAIKLWQIIINGLFEKGGSPSEVLPCLDQQDNEEWTLGMSIARNQTSEEVQAYLKLLLTLLDKGLAANSLLAHLEKGDWNFGMLVARYQTPAKVLVYLKLLTVLLDKGIAADSLLALLDKQNINGSTLGLFVTHYQTSAEVKAYLRLLLLLLDKGIAANSVLAHLDKQNNNGWTLGMKAARYQKSAGVLAYFKLLTALLDKGVPANSILAHLATQDKDGWTLGMKVARYQSAEEVQAYFKLLTALLDKGVAANSAMAYLEQHNKNGWTLGMFVARLQTSEEVLAYFKLLTTLLGKGVAANSILAQLEKEDSEGWAFVIKVAEFNKEGVDDFVVLLIQLAEKNLAKARLTTLLSQLKNGTSVLNVLRGNKEHYGPQIYQLARLGLIPESKMLPVKDYKQLITATLLSMPDDEEKLGALNQACGVSSVIDPIYRLIRQSSGSKIDRLLNRNSELTTLRRELKRVSILLEQKKDQFIPDIHSPVEPPSCEKSHTAMMMQRMPGASTATSSAKATTATKQPLPILEETMQQESETWGRSGTEPIEVHGKSIH